MDEKMKEITRLARTIDPSLAMGSDECIAWQRNNNTCHDCPHTKECQYFALGYLVATSNVLHMADSIYKQEGLKV